MPQVTAALEELKRGGAARLMQKLNNPALRFPRATILLCLAVFCAAALGIFQFRLSYDTRVFFNPEGSDLSTLRDFESKYGQNNDLLMVVWAGGRKVTEPDVLAALGDLVERAWTLPHSTRVDSLTNFPHVIADQDAFSVADLVPEPADTTETEAREIERLALDDPLILNRLLASDARATGVVVNFNLPPEASAEVREIVSAARTLVTEFEKENPGLEVKLTGNVILMATFSEAAMSDVTYLIPISLVVTAIVMFVFVRAVLPSLAILSLLGLSSAAAMGVAG